MSLRNCIKENNQVIAHIGPFDRLAYLVNANILNIFQRQLFCIFWDQGRKFLFPLSHFWQLFHLGNFFIELLPSNTLLESGRKTIKRFQKFGQKWLSLAKMLSLVIDEGKDPKLILPPEYFAQWNRQCIQSCSPGFESQVQHLWFFNICLPQIV